MHLQDIRKATIDWLEKYNKHERIADGLSSKFFIGLHDMSNESETFKYFNDYCEIIGIVVNSIKADRESVYELYSTRQMLSFFPSWTKPHKLCSRSITIYKTWFNYLKI